MGARVSILVLGLAHATIALPAQDPGWKLPERGAAEYQRQADRFDLRAGAELGDAGLRVVACGRDGGATWSTWQYDSLPPPPEWTTVGFDDSTWNAAPSAWGDAVGSDPAQRTPWHKRHIAMRTHFKAPRRRVAAVVLTVSHDDGIEVWLNGVSVFHEEGALDYAHHLLERDAVAALRPGDNVLAVRCTNDQGAQHVDVGLAVFWVPLAEQAYRDLLGDPVAGVQAIRRTLFPELRSPAFVLQGELDRDQERQRVTPQDLRDVPSWLGFDLGTVTARSMHERLPRLVGFGDLLVRGDVETPKDGSAPQVLQVELQSAPPAANGDSRAFVTHNILPFCQHRFEGRARIERTIGDGVVQHLDLTLDGTITPPKGAPVDLSMHETWDLQQVRPNRGTEFDTAVNDAIRDGARWLLDKIRDPKLSPVDASVGGDRSYGSGRLALVLLTLIKAGMQDDPVVQQGLAELRRRELVDTYSLANAIMAIEATYAPAGERADLHAGRIDAPRPRQPSASDLTLLTEWTERLLGNADERVDPDSVLRFTYAGGSDYDHSNTHFALLGLYSAHLCGVPIPPLRWRAAANHLMQDQSHESGRIPLTLTSYRDLLHPDEGRTGSAQPAAPGGWAYKGLLSGDGPEVVYGSMTAAGIVGLTVAQAGMRDTGQMHDAMFGRIDPAVASGFAWLAQNMTTRWNPCDPERVHHFVYYWLYALERACELSGIARIGDRDWYYEGAMCLLAWQREDGSWPNDVDGQTLDSTALAVLFLERAALPVYTR